jgi:hypothetical protein
VFGPSWPSGAALGSGGSVLPLIRPDPGGIGGQRHPSTGSGCSGGFVALCGSPSPQPSPGGRGGDRGTLRQAQGAQGPRRQETPSPQDPPSGYPLRRRGEGRDCTAQPGAASSAPTRRSGGFVALSGSPSPRPSPGGRGGETFGFPRSREWRHPSTGSGCSGGFVALSGSPSPQPSPGGRGGEHLTSLQRHSLRQAGMPGWAHGRGRSEFCVWLERVERFAAVRVLER